MESLAIIKPDGEVDVLYTGGNFTMPFQEFKDIRELFKHGGILNCVTLNPTAIINYLEESNPLLMQTEIEIEKNKIRRSILSPLGEYGKYIVPISILLICAALAFKMLTMGNTAGASTVVESTANSPILIK
jgi:hypothetical protein